MSKRKPVVFGAAHSPVDVAASCAARDGLRAALATLVEQQHHPTAILNALMTLYIELSLSIFGIDLVEQGLRLVLAELPRMAAVLAASDAPPAGHA